MRPDTITMTMRQLDRLKVLQALADGHLKTAIAAARLGLSSRQTLRLLRRYQSEGPSGLGIMIDAGFWVPRKLRPPRVHQPRNRRACLGELVQIDGSDHAWFEDRAPACTLLVYVDDATSRLMQLLFVPTESTLAHFHGDAGVCRAAWQAAGVLLRQGWCVSQQCAR